MGLQNNHNHQTAATTTTNTIPLLIHSIIINIDCNYLLHPMLIILRLSQTGVFNQFGQSRPVKMTRLGEPLENAAAVIGTHTVDYQVEQLLIQDPEYIKYQVLLDQLNLQQEKDNEKDNDNDKDVIPSKASLLDYMITAQVLFPYVIIDEAAQTTEPSTLIPLKCGCTHDN